MKEEYMKYIQGDVAIIPQGVKEIGFSAFEGCSSLVEIKLPTSVQWIRWKAFSGCSNLKNIVIPNSVLWVGDNAFENCINLNSIEIQRGTAIIGRESFAGCINLTDIVLYPPYSSAIDIRKNAFGGCNSISRFHIHSSFPDYMHYVVEEILITAPLKDFNKVSFYVPVGLGELYSLHPYYYSSEIIESKECSTPFEMDHETEELIIRRYLDYIKKFQYLPGYESTDYEGMYRDAFENDPEAEWGARW